ncbi:nucleotidyltransferase family protein [Pseudomonas citronellolis]|uniref:nucleotidyltransferase family protein n=1 Tax=Pseudomonas citronellolis TaxID=53408 RepID=UPI0023E3750D|nr:nucleotidyltransferase family protein [Pseudomonas citronellolis]MDF3937125.1 nucleotidyltransferase family protein [Pseudomonas citronellolis]
MTPERLAALLAASPERLRLLRVLRAAGPSGAWIGAGFVRNAVWDALHQHAEATPLADVDVLYFDPGCLDAEPDYAFERQLALACPEVNWSVRNQARMHLRNGDRPYADIADALRHWPEVCTAVAVRLRGEELELLAPLGLDDLFALRVRPTEHFRGKPAIYRERQLRKDWRRRWPLLRVEPL